MTSQRLDESFRPGFSPRSRRRVAARRRDGFLVPDPQERGRGNLVVLSFFGIPFPIVMSVDVVTSKLASRDP